MFGKKNKEIARLTEELASATASLTKMYAEYEEKLSNAKDDINAREATITAQKSEIDNLKKSYADSENARHNAVDARDVIASQLTNEGTLRTNAESALSASRREEDPDTDAFYNARFAAEKAKPEGDAGSQPNTQDDASAPTSAQKAKETKRSARR